MMTQTHMTYEVPRQSEILRELRTAMEAHQTNLRLDINHMEVIVGCIAKSTDEDVVKYLPEANESISSLRECLSTLNVHWRIFEIKQGSVDYARIEMSRAVPSLKKSPMRH
jgi:hypothetical protein